MKKITANKNTKLKKEAIDSTLLNSNQYVEVPKGKFYFITSEKQSKNNHKEVVLGHGAGTWNIWPPDWDELGHDFIPSCIESCKSQGLNLKTQWAYIIATAYWETNKTFKPVVEAYWLSENWRKENLRYWPYHGRGYVQITWEEIYDKYSKILGLDLVKNPDLALNPKVSMFILTHGFKEGVFTGLKIEDFINESKTDFVGCRRCINGTDKDKEIAELAREFLIKL